MKPFAVAPLALLAAALAGGSVHAASYHYTDHWDYVAKPALGATSHAALVQLRAAEQAAVGILMSRLNGASPSLAQLYASIAASEATHVSVLNARVGTS